MVSIFNFKFYDSFLFYLLRSWMSLLINKFKIRIILINKFSKHNEINNPLCNIKYFDLYPSQFFFSDGL
jgi:hypothetical protein